MKQVNRLRTPIVHETAEVQSLTIGNGTVIWQNCIVRSVARIGENCNINAFCYVDNDVVIGDNVTLKCGVYIWDGITIEDDVFIGPNATFTNDKYPRSKQHLTRPPRTIVRKGASVGANATVVAGVVVGEFSLVAAGAVVTKDVPPYSIVVGNPARWKRNICACKGAILRAAEEIECECCKKTYKLRGDRGLTLSD